MTRAICHCELCGASSADVTVDVYNDFDDEPGNLFCDDCACGPRDHQAIEVVMPARPEGYYHAPIGTFD